MKRREQCPKAAVSTQLNCISLIVSSLISTVRLITRARAIVFLAVWLVCSAVAAASNARADDFVVAGNGEPYLTMWRQVLIPAFEKETGLRVVWSGSTTAEVLTKLVTQRRSPQIDVALVDEPQFAQGSDLGLWIPIKRSDLGDLTDISSEALIYNQGVAYGFSSVGLYFNANAFAAEKLPPLRSWRDLLRPEFKGRITMLSAANAAGIDSLVAFNEINGGKSQVNLDKGFQFAKRLASQAFTIDTYGDTPQLVEEGASIAGVWVQQRVARLATTGVPIRFVQPVEGIWGHRAMAAIVKGRDPRHTEAAKHFLALLLTQEVQRSSLPLNPLAVNRRVLSSEAKKMVETLHFVDEKAISRGRASLVDRWMKEVEWR